MIFEENNENSEVDSFVAQTEAIAKWLFQCLSFVFDFYESV